MNGIENSWQPEFQPSYYEKKVLITGANGFIGKNLVEALDKLNANVFCIDRDNSPSDTAIKSQYQQVDLANLLLVNEVISKFEPEIIFHLAGLVTARQDRDLVIPMIDNNLLGTVNLFLAANQSNLDRIVIITSPEDRQGNIPTSPYGASKAATVIYARMFHHLYSLPVVIVRLFFVYGPKQKHDKLIPYTVNSMLQNQSPKLGSGNRICDFIFVQDVVHGLLKAGIQKNLDGETLEIGSGKGITIQDLISMIDSIYPFSAKPSFGAIDDRYYESSQIANLDMYRGIWNWEPRWSLREGLTKTIMAYKEELKNSDG